MWFDAPIVMIRRKSRLPLGTLLKIRIRGLEQLPRALPVFRQWDGTPNSGTTHQSQACPFKPQHCALQPAGGTPVRARRSIGVVQNVAHLATTSPSTLLIRSSLDYLDLTSHVWLLPRICELGIGKAHSHRYPRLDLLDERPFHELLFCEHARRLSDRVRHGPHEKE